MSEIRAHDSWAEVYDLAYAEEFGALYEKITRITVDEIRRLAPDGGTIADFGAGTGRLALPLANHGYRVTAIDPSGPMLDRIRQARTAIPITCVQCGMQDFATASRFDFAACVFTVITYLLDEGDLRRALANAAACLVPGGRLLLDIPGSAIFAGRRCRTDQVCRKVSIEPLGGPVFHYQEQLTVGTGDTARRYSDAFRIRHWSVEDVLDAASAAGLEIAEDLSPAFAMTGSRYFVLSVPQAGLGPGAG